MQDKRLGGLDLESLWATAKSAKEKMQHDAQYAVAKTKVKTKPSKLKAAMVKADLEVKEANRKLPRFERDPPFAGPRYEIKPMTRLFYHMNFGWCRLSNKFCNST